MSLYIKMMSKIEAIDTDLTVRDSKTGRIITVHGVGALKGQLKLKKNVDLTKPIASQAAKTTPARKSLVSTKH
ncbi:hypothetical protein [Novosphingobium sp. 28-62-57]|nr:hypothetical protein [Novosphingobium sp. 28-62-57]